MEYEIRLARPDELDRLVEVTESGRQYLREQGVPQWQNGSGPGRKEIETDIERARGYVLEVAGAVGGYASLVSGPEGSPALVEGTWAGPVEHYITIHRVALDASVRGGGYAGEFLGRVIQIAKDLGYPDIRIDTHPQNVIMQKVIGKAGFLEVGVLELPILNGKRLAYQLLVDASQEEASCQS